MACALLTSRKVTTLLRRLKSMACAHQQEGDDAGKEVVLVDSRGLRILSAADDAMPGADGKSERGRWKERDGRRGSLWKERRHE